MSNDVKKQNESKSISEDIIKSEKKTINRELELSDLDSVSGGVQVVASTQTENLTPTVVNQRCNCGKFEPHTPGLNLDICDNCKHALKTDANSNTTYCGKQQFGDTSSPSPIPQPIVIS